jgi:hypothetical protein
VFYFSNYIFGDPPSMSRPMLTFKYRAQWCLVTVFFVWPSIFFFIKIFKPWVWNTDPTSSFYVPLALILFLLYYYRIWPASVLNN